MDDRLVAVEVITVAEFDHDCPGLHGGSCEPKRIQRHWYLDGRLVDEDEARQCLTDDQLEEIYAVHQHSS